DRTRRSQARSDRELRVAAQGPWRPGPGRLRAGAILDAGEDGDVSWLAFEVQSRRRAQLVDITEKVAEAVDRSGIVEGVCHVFIPHTTAGVTINEGADPDV